MRPRLFDEFEASAGRDPSSLRRLDEFASWAQSALTGAGRFRIAPSLSIDMRRRLELGSRGSRPLRARFQQPRRNRLFLAKAALAAGPAVMEEYDRGCDVASKADGSPVTSADHRAEAIICECLARMVPSTPLCAEEAMAAGAKPHVAERFLLVDPLDGTREFLAGNGEFTINVALIEKGAPIAGAVYAPAIGRFWVGATRRSPVRRPPARSRRDRTAHSNSSRAHELGRFCKPFASRRPVRFLPQKIAHRGDKVRGFIAQVLPYRRGPRRRLSAVRANDGVGHRGWRCGAASGRRRGSRSFRTSAFVRQGRARDAQRRVHRLGGRSGR